MQQQDRIPHYYAWYQMDPQQGNVPITLTVRAGDTIWVSVEDTDGVTPESPKFGNPGKIPDTPTPCSSRTKPRNTKWSKNGLKPGDGVRAPDATAEVITEAVSNGPYFVGARGAPLRHPAWRKRARSTTPTSR